MLSLFLSDTYVHIPEATQFTSKLDGIFIVRDNSPKLTSLFHNDKLIFYKDKIEVIIYKQHITFTYFELKRWRTEPEDSELILFLEDSFITINSCKPETMQEILSILDKTIQTIMNSILEEL